MTIEETEHIEDLIQQSAVLNTLKFEIIDALKKSIYLYKKSQRT